MTKFVKINRHITDTQFRSIILNTSKIVQIFTCTSLHGQPLIGIELDNGDHYHILEDDWACLGIELVQELHSGWEEVPELTAADLGQVDLCQGEPIKGVAKAWHTDRHRVLGSMEWKSEHSHKLGTQQYVKDES